MMVSYACHIFFSFSQFQQSPMGLLGCHNCRQHRGHMLRHAAATVRPLVFPDPGQQSSEMPLGMPGCSIFALELSLRSHACCRCRLSLGHAMLFVHQIYRWEGCHFRRHAMPLLACRRRRHATAFSRLFSSACRLAWPSNTGQPSASIAGSGWEGSSPGGRQKERFRRHWPA